MFDWVSWVLKFIDGSKCLVMKFIVREMSF